MNAGGMRQLVVGMLVLGAAINLGMAQDEDEGAPEKPQVPGTIVKAKGPIVIDGRLDEADWKQAKPIAANYVFGKKNVISPEPRMNVRYLWDDAYLYIGYEVFDTNLVAVGNGEMDGPPGNRRPGCEHRADTNKPVDVVEFIIFFEDRNFFWEIQHNASNQFNDILCIVALPSWQKTKIAFASSSAYWEQAGMYFACKEYIQDEDDRTLASAVKLSLRKDGKPSTVNDSSDVDTGYTGELRLPWYGIGAPLAARTKAGDKPGPWKMADREISILAVVQDGDAPAPKNYFTSSPATVFNTFFILQTEHFPRYVIRGFEPWAW